MLFGGTKTIKKMVFTFEMFCEIMTNFLGDPFMVSFLPAPLSNAANSYIITLHVKLKTLYHKKKMRGYRPYGKVLNTCRCLLGSLANLFPLRSNILTCLLSCGIAMTLCVGDIDNLQYNAIFLTKGRIVYRIKYYETD